MIGPRIIGWFVAFVLGGAVAVGGLTVANGRLPLPEVTASPTPTASPVMLPDDAWATTTSTALPVSVTTPGSLLVAGSPGQVAIALGDGKRALVSITAQAPTPASEADHATLQRSVPQLAGMSVFYYRVVVSKVAGSDLAGIDLRALFDAVTTDGTVVQRLTIVDWRACSAGALPVEIDESAVEVPLCFAAATPRDGLVPDGVRFAQSGGPYDSANGTAVSWMP